MITPSNPTLPQSPPATPSDGALILASLTGRIQPVGKSPMYMLGLVLVAGLMLLLPLIYLLLIAAVGFAVVWHVLHDAYLLDQLHDLRAVLLVYFAPIVVGAIVMLFMIKPLFRRRGPGGKPLTLSRNEQPLVYAYVDHLCDIVGAPHPLRIDVDCQVNASASFVGAAGLLTGDVVLTLGLPLAAGLDLRLFTGVLAHELGHFAQGSGMRLTYLVRAINLWFARVVYERDSWDQSLRRAALRGHYLIRLTCQLCRLLIWLTRRALWSLMYVGSATSAIMQRQMEFDADRYEAAVAGAGALEETFTRLPALLVAYQASMSQLAAAWRERRLADDLPQLICRREAALDDKLRMELTARQSKAKTKWFDSHPSDLDRIQSARRANAPGILSLDLPATSLFRNFTELSRRATLDFYRLTLGSALRPEHLQTTQAMADRRDEQQQSAGAQQRFFQGLLTPLLPLRVFEELNLPPSNDELASLIIECRTQLQDSAPRAALAVKQFHESIATLDRVLAVRALRAADMRVEPAAFGFTTAAEPELNSVEQTAAAARLKSREILHAALLPQARRLGAALALTAAPPAPPPDTPPSDDVGEYDLADSPDLSGPARLMNALRSLSDCQDAAERLRQRQVQLTALMKVTRRENNKKSLVLELLAMSKKVYADLSAVHATLRAAPYPYDHAERGATISRYCCSTLPASARIGEIHTAAKATLEGIYTLYLRLMSDLAQTAESAEQSLGLPPLPPPSQP